MFDMGDGGVGDQLAMYRLMDAFRQSAQQRDENNAEVRAARLAADYKRLAAYAKSLEVALKARDEQLAATRADLAHARRHLAGVLEDNRVSALVRMERGIKIREQERAAAARSQQT